VCRATTLNLTSTAPYQLSPSEHAIYTQYLSDILEIAGKPGTAGSSRARSIDDDKVEKQVVKRFLVDKLSVESALFDQVRDSLINSFVWYVAELRLGAAAIPARFSYRVSTSLPPINRRDLCPPQTGLPCSLRQLFGWQGDR
jgi:hypothetical protein